MKDNSPIRRPQNILRQKRRRRNIRIVLLVLLAVVIIAASFSAIFMIFYRPDRGNQPVNRETSSLGDEPLITDEEGNILEDDHDPNITQVTNAYNFLVLGRDNVGLNTDVFMLVSFDIDDKTIAVCQIPRDTYIEIDNHPYKINAAYSVMHSRAYHAGDKDAEDTAMRELMTMLETNLAIDIQDYALCNLQGFRNIIDKLGGVSMYVPYDMDYDDPEQGLSIHLKKGQQVLNGKKAEDFIRFREGYVEADMGRQDAQKLFISALIQQLKNSMSVNTILGMVSELAANVKTSMSVIDMMYYVKEFYLIDNTNITFVSFPGQACRANVDYGAWYYIMYREEMLHIVNTYFNVTTSPVTDAQFDPNHVFVNENKSHIRDIYYKDSSGISETHTAEDLINDGLYIPLLP